MGEGELVFEATKGIRKEEQGRVSQKKGGILHKKLTKKSPQIGSQRKRIGENREARTLEGKGLTERLRGNYVISMNRKKEG